MSVMLIYLLNTMFFIVNCGIVCVELFSYTSLTMTSCLGLHFVCAPKVFRFYLLLSLPLPFIFFLICFFCFYHASLIRIPFSLVLCLIFCTCSTCAPTMLVILSKEFYFYDINDSIMFVCFVQFSVNVIMVPRYLKNNTFSYLFL